MTQRGCHADRTKSDLRTDRAWISSPRRSTSGCLVMMVCRDHRARVLPSAEAIGCWQEMKSLRWARTSLRRVSPMYITVSTWAAARSCTMPLLPSTGAGPVEETSLTRFADGHPIWVRPAGPTGLPCAEIVRRARSRLGEDRYRFLSNNCEHLSEWCVNGEHRSSQVERLLKPLRRVSRALNRPYAIAAGHGA